MSPEKTEVMWVGHRREELNIKLDGKEIKEMDGFVYLGGMVTENGQFRKSERESPENVCYTSMPVWSGL